MVAILGVSSDYDYFGQFVEQHWKVFIRTLHFGQNCVINVRFISKLGAILGVLRRNDNLGLIFQVFFGWRGVNALTKNVL